MKSNTEGTLARFIIFGLVAALGLLAVGELVSRYVLGLGTPPLSVTHPRIEYLFAPDQDVSRFGNRQLYNEYGMRSLPVSDWPSGKRILVLGDSVLNGGNLTDHADLATTEAQDLSETAVFGNVSAGSWGIDNMLGWVETFGTLDAQAVILVLSSHDAKDVPSFRGLNPRTHPTEGPNSALSELISRYGVRYLPASLRPLRPDLQPIETSHVGRSGIEALPLLLDLFSMRDIRSCLVLHAERREMTSNDFSGLDPFQELAVSAGVPTVLLPEVLMAEGADLDAVFRDEIHITNVGQDYLRSALLQCERALAQ
ncbi:MAG: hypothetical protein AAFS08_17595 [Pseudomonadota bacterium]